MHKKRMDDADQLVAILKRTPGLTQLELVRLHQIAPGLLYRCLEQKLIVAVGQVTKADNGGYGRPHVFRFYAANGYPVPNYLLLDDDKKLAT